MTSLHCLTTRARRLTPALAIVAAAGAMACASTQKPSSLSQAESLYQQLSTTGAEQRAEGPMLRARESINDAENSVARHQNQDYVNGLSHIALRDAQTADAENARLLAQQAADSLHRARLARLLTLSEAQRQQLAAQQQLSQSEIVELQRRNLLANAQADTLRQRADSLRRAAMEANQRLDSAMNRLQSLVSEITNIKETTRGLVISLSDILFDVDKATIKPGALSNINRIAGILNQFPNYKISVEGHTDNTGSAQYNMQLSQRRAEAVRQALINGGVDSTRITATGFGLTQPVATNATAAGRQQNRRVEVVVLGAGTVANALQGGGAASDTTHPPFPPVSADTMRRDTTRRDTTRRDTSRTNPPR